ncbi:MAG: LysR family transcriptional regulator [Gemmobacter sp.]|nr:LysR family transcriptional regulator [Gemmobacter sp.]
MFLFEAAARHENFTRAAEEMNVTQPAVSRSLAALEDYLGCSLFQRGKSGARLTEEGRLLHEAVKTGFSHIDQGLSRLEARRSGKTQITLSVSTAFTTHWLMPRIARCQAAFPELDLRFQLIAGPVSGPIGDVDIAMRYVGPGDVSGKFVMHEAYLPVCAPSYLARTSEPEKRTFIQLEGDKSSRFTGVEGWADNAENAQLTFSDYSVVVQAALVGQGIAAGWLNVTAHWLNEGQLVPAANRLTRPGRVCRLVTRQDTGNSAPIHAISDWMIEELRADLHATQSAYPDIEIASLLERPNIRA